MDLLSRLIAGSGSTKQKPNPSHERLNLCKRLCGALQQIWRNGTRLSNDDSASQHVASLILRLNAILHDESRKAAPHSCLQYATSNQIYIIVTKLTLSSDSAEVVAAATQFFHHLIDGEAEGVLDSKIFARALVDLVRRSTIFSTIAVDEQGEADLVELLFEIATKVRLDPEILPGWFYPERDPNRSKLAGAEARRAQFPLFYLLVDYVHHDGPTGDFARTGLLYLTETASRSKPLEKWMIESDLAPQMASGLSALYSRLSRYAPSVGETEKTIPLVALSDPTPSTPYPDEEKEELQHSVKAFLSYLNFWQDTLNHCKSQEVKDTLLDHFQVLFVQQLLYPSLLESSDVAGGSTAAVILHLYRLLDTIDYEIIVKRMLHYLLASSRSETKTIEPRQGRSRMSMSRRQSMDQLTTLAAAADAPSPDLFNLLDLMIISLHSRHPQTVCASLKLMTMILQRHHHHALHALFNTFTLSAAVATQSLVGFDTSMIALLDLAASISQVETADESYENALNDGKVILERHSCIIASLNTSVISALPERLAISSSDKLFEALLQLLQSFFSNDATTNIVLTETFISLASCQHISLRSWLISSGDEFSEQAASVRTVLEELVEQTRKWQAQFSEWNLLFSYTKDKLEDGESSRPAAEKVPSISAQSRTSSAPRPSPQLNPVDAKGTPTRSTTPAKATPRMVKMPPPSTFGSIDSALVSPTKFGSSPGKAMPSSPLRKASFAGPAADAPGAGSIASGSSVPSDASLSQLKQQVDVTINETQHITTLPVAGIAERLKLEQQVPGLRTPQSEQTSGAVTPSVQEEDAIRTSVSLSHILTNAIILQEFIYELGALLQIRSTMFDEVDVSHQPS